MQQTLATLFSIFIFHYGVHWGKMAALWDFEAWSERLGVIEAEPREASWPGDWWRASTKSLRLVCRLMGSLWRTWLVLWRHYFGGSMKVGLAGTRRGILVCRTFPCSPFLLCPRLSCWAGLFDPNCPSSWGSSRLTYLQACHQRVLTSSEQDFLPLFCCHSVLLILPAHGVMGSWLH